MSPDLNNLLKNAGPRAIAPVALDEVAARARRWRAQRLIGVAAGLAIVLTSGVGAWAMLDPLQPDGQQVSPGTEACDDGGRVMVFLRDDITAAELQILEDDLAEREGIADASYSSKEAAYEEFKDFHIDEPQYWENLPKDALPAFIRITVEDNMSGEQRAQLIDDLRRYRGVDAVQHRSRQCGGREREHEERLVTVPDLAGLSLQRACEAVEGQLTLRAEGVGRQECQGNAAVTNQDPAPGTQVLLGSEVVVVISPTKDAPQTDAGALDELYVELRLNKDSVEAGSRVGSVLIVENRTETPITDPECYLGSPSFGILKQADAELWQARVLNCGGPYTIAPGERQQSQGPDFAASTQTGEPLEPGQYLAVAEFRGRSERIVVQVTVVE